MNENTQKVINDLKAAGIDTSGIERQLQVDPLKDRQADNIIGGGILRQAEYTRFMNETKRLEEELKVKANALATSHDGIQYLVEGSEAHKAMKGIIDDYEKDLIDAGFSEDSVKALSSEKNKKLESIVTKAAPTPTPNNPDPNRGNQMPNSNLPNNLVDTDMLTGVLSNMAMGNVLINMQINAQEKELTRLGINPTPEQMQQLQSKLPEHLSTAGKSVATAFNEVFKVDEVRATKAQESREAEITAARAEGAAAALREAGIPARKITKLISHPVLDSKTIGQNANRNATPSYMDEQGNIDPNKLPKNAAGEVEMHKIRGVGAESVNKPARLQRAAALMDQIQEHYANDPTYIG